MALDPEKNTVTRREFLQTSLAGASAKVLARNERMRPNILYINSHDSGRYLQPYGYSVPTPHLQRLAEEGVLFRRAFSAAPTCSPSRASLLTGMWAHSNGMMGLANRNFAMPDYRQHLLHTLRPAGYRSTLIGLQHIAKNSTSIGFDEIIHAGKNMAADVAPAAVNFLNHAPAQPFYLEVGFFETHRPYRSPAPQDDARFCVPPLPIPDAPPTRQDMAAFKATARALDEGIGLVLKALETNGLASNTLVIYATDHGLPFPNMKCHLTDHGIGVALIMRGPDGFSGGKICDAMVSQIDVFPTICDLLRIEPPPRLQGKSMMPLIRDDAKEINEEVFAEVNYHASYEPKRAVRTQRWKYVRRFDTSRTRPIMTNCDDGPSKTLWLDYGWKNRPLEMEGLYDLIFDPNEVRNLVGEPSQRAVLEEMRGRLDRWMRATDDPILQGPIKAPRGVELNSPDQDSYLEPLTVVE